MISSIHSVSHLYVTLQCWEYGISLCRELAFQYETLYDYQSLSWIRVSKVLRASCFCCYYQTSILCDAGRRDFSLSSSYAVRNVYSVKHNVLITCARPHSSRNAEDSVACVIKSLFIMTLLHVYLSVTENGGSVL